MVAVPYTFTNNINQIIDADQINADFQALVDAVNTLISAGFTGLQPVATFAAFRAMAAPVLVDDPLPAVSLIGSYMAGDRAPVVYVYSYTSTANDNGGTVIKPSSVGHSQPGRWLSCGFPDLQGWGATDCTNVGSGSIFATSANLTLAAAGDFIDGQPIFVVGAGAAPTVQQPANVTLATGGTPAATTYNVRVASVDGAGGIGPATASVANGGDGAATLGDVIDLSGAAKYQTVTVTAPVSGPTPVAYVIYFGTTAGSEVAVGLMDASQTTWNYFGTPQNLPDWVPSAPLSSAQNQFLSTSISSGGGTASLTLADVAIATVISQPVVHDSTDAWTRSLAHGVVLNVPIGRFATTAPLPITTDYTAIVGAQQGGSSLAAWGGYDILTFNGVTEGGVRFMQIDATNMGAGFIINVTGHNAKECRFDNLDIVNQFNLWQIGDGVDTTYWSASQYRGSRGPYNIYIWGDNTGQTTAHYFDTMRETTSGPRPNWSNALWINGNVQTVNMNLVGMASRFPTMLEVNNAIGATSGPSLARFRGVGANFSQNDGIHITGANGITIEECYIQGCAGNQGSGIYTDNMSSRTSVSNSTIFSFGVNGLQLHGQASFISNCSAPNNPIAIEIYDTAINTTIVGGGCCDSIGPVTALKTGCQTGILIHGGALGTRIAGGIWYGQVTNIDNSAGADDVSIMGDPYGSPPNSGVAAAGNQSLTVASYPSLYQGYAGKVAHFDASGFGGGTPTYTLDTAANIAASFPSGFKVVGLTFNFRIWNHQNGQITIAGGTGTTIGTNPNVPASGGTNQVTYRDFTGILTNVGGGTEAVSIHGLAASGPGE